MISCRLDEFINRGGDKLFPCGVDDMIQEHPAVAEVATFAPPHPKPGEKVATAVVLRGCHATSPGPIRAFACPCLAAFKAPRAVVVVDDMPQGPTGKPQRIGPAEKLGLRA